MLRRGIFRVAVYARSQKTCAAGVKNLPAAAAGTRAWLSATPGGDSSDSDDVTPPKTKLAFSSSVYGKDPASGGEPTAEEAAAAAQLKREAEAGTAREGAAAAPVHDNRNMFDSSLSQQAEDGKESGSIKRDVAADTPDATRVAFGATAYGKDPEAAAALSEQEAEEVEALRARAKGDGVAGAAAAPLHDRRNMFDSDLTQGAGSTQAFDAIKRDVKTDTPDATRVAFRASAYGKDPQTAAALSEQEAAEVEALRMRAQGRGAAAAAPVHDSRSMFDSDLTQGAGSTQGSESIKRDVSGDTPDATRVAFRASVYGKDGQAAAALSEQEAAEVDELRVRAHGAGASSADAAPVHDSRSMFDSDLTQGAGAMQGSDSIKRHVAANTPEATRLVFAGSDYGKDPRSVDSSEKKKAEIAALAERVGAGTPAAAAAPIHHDRSMFDSDLAEGAGAARESTAIKRHVETATPALTRLSFFGSTYGDDDPGSNKADHAQALAEKQKKGAKLARVGAGVQSAKVHNTEKAMADDEYSQAGSE
ncbi:unnamed protein product [Ectocarpus sp. 6 AP-2014]